LLIEAGLSRLRSQHLYFTGHSSTNQLNSGFNEAKFLPLQTNLLRKFHQETSRKA
jgi:hypothetical protein